MSFRHIAVVLSVSLGVTLLARAAASEDRLITLVSAGTAGVSDVSYTTNQNSGGGHDCVCGCEDNCCSGPRWHWTGGVEATYLIPKLRAFAELGIDNQIQAITEPGWTAAPRIWLGVENCNGWGARVRYWQLCANRSAFGITPEEGVLVDMSQNLDMYDIDCELTKRFELGCWQVLGSIGGRYASIERLLTFNVLEFPNDSAFIGFGGLTSAGGLTFALEASRPIGCTGFDLFGTLRVSPMWGDNRGAVHVRTNEDGDLDTVDDRESDPIDLTIWEAQVGVQCQKYLACCCGTVFARCGFEYQAWIPTTGAVGNFMDTDLYGVAVAVGFYH